ncbi:hypothetical protein PCANC_23996 [Puccinia coronata f. sp. avenae]|uniref:Uncharacterized protein n=1 Tax=Puccinia coronata f. sp. avenae TaxID=200324 RepID=A0A2N5TS85_9BASI|nr:hypothetical protein PCANC_23996 [Puccinia coronata f. sp. avenae]
MDLTPDSQLSSQSPLPSVSSAKTPSASVPHLRRSNQAQSSASRLDVPPSSGQEESDDGSASRRSFPNQRQTNRSSQGPQDASNKAKSSVASALEHANEMRFGYLDRHIVWDKENHKIEQENCQNMINWDRYKYLKDSEQSLLKEGQRMAWEKEKYGRDQALLVSQLSRTHNLEEARLAFKRDRKENRLAFEKDQLAFEKAKFQEKKKEQRERMEMVKGWIKEGKSSAAIEELLTLMYGSLE